MNRSRIRVIGSAVLIAGIAAFVGWQEHRHAQRLQGSVRDLRKDAAALEGQAAALTRQVADLEARAKRAEPDAAPPGPTQPSPAPAKSADDLERDKQAAIARAIAGQRVHLFVDQERYLRPFFDRLGLSPQQWDAYRQLGIARLEARSRISPSLTGPERRQALAAVELDFQNGVERLIGDGPARELKAYQQRQQEFMAPATVASRQLQHLLLLGDAPLNPGQVTQLQSLIAARAGGSLIPAVTPETVEQAQVFLTPVQMEYWRSLQSAYEYEKQLEVVARQPPPATAAPDGTVAAAPRR